jgi:hypothetical protein
LVVVGVLANLKLLPNNGVAPLAELPPNNDYVPPPTVALFEKLKRLPGRASDFSSVLSPFSDDTYFCLIPGETLLADESRLPES